MAEDIRISGIDLIGDISWGTHFCQFYESGQDLLDILVPYFKAGLENNEFCMWVTAEPVGVQDARRAMTEAMPDVDRYLESGQLEIIPHNEWYLKGGTFDSARVLAGWVGKLNAALGRGHDGLRLTGNTFWLEKRDWQSFADYEREVDDVIGQYRIVALCTYWVGHCGVSEVADVIANHQFALVKRQGHWQMIESAERKRAEAERERLLVELEQRAAELSAANKELETFAYSVSHDLRTPLRALDGFSKVLLESYADKLDDQGKGYLALLREGSQRMSQIIDDLLELSRTTRLEMRLDRIDLSEIAQGVADGLRRTDHGRRVEFIIAPSLVDYGDARLLRLALENLLGNAWKFTSKHATARIEFGAVEQDRKRVYFVRDDGAGFDVAYVDKLFGAFQRLHREKEFPGTGVGLATVQRIINRHGGSIRAEGEVERGATFYFTLNGVGPPL